MRSARGSNVGAKARQDIQPDHRGLLPLQRRNGHRKRRDRVAAKSGSNQQPLERLAMPTHRERETAERASPRRSYPRGRCRSRASRLPPRSFDHSPAGKEIRFQKSRSTSCTRPPSDESGARSFDGCGDQPSSPLALHVRDWRGSKRGQLLILAEREVDWRARSAPILVPSPPN